MKELSIEEKARRYDGAIKRLEDIETGKCQKTFMFTEGLFDYIFPELKLSEDEKIRESLLEYLHTLPNHYAHSGVCVPEWIAWLEKQEQHTKFMESIQIGDKVTRNRDGVLVNLSQLNRVAKPVDKQTEKNPADNVEPKFHEGDIIIHKELGGDYIHNPHKIIQVDISDKKYRLEGGLVAHFGEQEDYELVEQKPAAWSEEDAKLWLHDDDIFLDAAKMIVGDSPRRSYGGVHKKEIVPWLLSLKERLKALEIR